jgi:hypothetical protein
MKVNRGTVMVALALALAAPAGYGAEPGSAGRSPIVSPETSSAHSAASSPESVARAMGEEGLRRFRAGKWQESRREPEATAKAPEHAPSLLLPTCIALGAGSVALVTGAITGGVSLRQADDVKSRCVSGHCPPSDQATAAAAGHLADASTGLFVAGGVATATGVLLAVLHARAPGPRVGTLHVDVGPGYGAVGGAF